MLRNLLETFKIFDLFYVPLALVFLKLSTIDNSIQSVSCSSNQVLPRSFSIWLFLQTSDFHGLCYKFF